MRLPCGRQRILQIALVLMAISSSLQAHAEGGRTPSTAGVVSPSHPDPNFIGTGTDGLLTWNDIGSGGEPRLGYAVKMNGLPSLTYLGFDKTGWSYVGIESADGNKIYGYTRDKGLMPRDIPDALYKPRRFTDSTVIYANALSGAQVAAGFRTLGEPTPDAPKVRWIDSTWQLAFIGDDGAQRHLPLFRAVMIWQGRKITKDAWKLPAYLDGSGSFILVQDGKYRYVVNERGKVDVFPSMRQPALIWDALRDALTKFQIKLLDADSPTSFATVADSPSVANPTTSTSSNQPVPVHPVAATPTPAAAGTPLPELLQECEKSTFTICGTWTRNATGYSGQWPGGSIAQITVVRWDDSGVQLQRVDSAGPATGLTAIYKGSRDARGNYSGSVTFTFGGGTASGTWTGSASGAAPAP